MAWNGFCALCEAKVSYFTQDTVTVNGERRTLMLCQRCWIKIRHPERVKKPKEPTTIVQNTAVREEKHIIQGPQDDAYKKVEGHIGTVPGKDEEHREEVETIREQ